VTSPARGRDRSRILLLNAGSSSLKCSLMESADGTVVARASADWAGPVTHYERSGPGAERVRERVAFRAHGEAVRHALADLVASSVVAVGHRIVHGGEFTASVRITPAVRATREDLAMLSEVVRVIAT